MSVKITVIYDNRCDNLRLKEGWGFSTLIEFEGKKVLFDTGADYSGFSSNAEILQVLYDEITHLVFSHRHSDHVAGFKKIVEKLNPGIPLYVPKGFPWLLRRKASSRLKLKVKEKCAHVVQECLALGVQKVAPCHCSGEPLIRQFQDTYDSNFYKIGTGTNLLF